MKVLQNRFIILFAIISSGFARMSTCDSHTPICVYSIATCHIEHSSYGCTITHNICSTCMYESAHTGIGE